MFELYGGTSALAYQPVGISGDVLSFWYQSKASNAAARAAGPQLSGASRSANAQPKDEIVPPWDPGADPSPASALALSALASGEFLNAKTLGGFSDINAPDDHKKLFALHQALKTLSAIAAEAADKTTAEHRRSFLNRRYLEGIEQITGFLGGDPFEGLKIFAGQTREKAESTVGIPRAKSEYVTPVLHEGAVDDEVAAFTGDARFNVTVRKNGVDTLVAIDLADMTGARTLDNVADHINAEFASAGVVTTLKRFKLGEPDDSGVIPGNRYAFKVMGVETEKLTFSAVDGAPAFHLIGSSGGSTISPTIAGRITKISDLGAAAPTIGASQRLEAVDEAETGVTIKTAAAAPGGGFYALAETDANLAGGTTIRGEKDVVLVKYDTTGRQVWSRALGASESADGLSLAVTAAGDVVVGGAITGAFGGTISTGGADAFAAKFNAAGQEQWVKRFGGSGDERVTAVTVDASGAIYVAGSTSSPLAGAPHGGGRDGFVRALNTDGSTAWTRQFGGAGEEAVTAVAIAQDGSLLVASTEDGAGFLRKFTAANGDDPALWSHALGDLDSGSIAGVAVDGGDIYLAGSARSGMDGTGAVTAHSGGARDAFVVKLTDGASPTEAFRTFLGTSAEDTVADIEVSGGKIYLAGRTDGSLPGGGVLVGERNAFAASLDAATGALDWTTQITGRGGSSSGAAIAFDAEGSSALDRFGFPRGDLTYSDSAVIAERTSARSGDYFYVRLDGGAKRKIQIDADDTLRALTFKIGAVLGLDGEAAVSRLSTGDKLRITPKPGHAIELIAGDEGGDLLRALGLEPGHVEKPAIVDEDAKDAARAPLRIALKLTDAKSLASLDLAVAAREVLDRAMTEVRRAYREITRDPALDKALAQAGRLNGPVPAYLTARIAAYQDALARLGGGY